MRQRMIAIIGLASALALSQHANATAPPTEVGFRTAYKEVAMQPRDTVPSVDYQSTAATVATTSIQGQALLVHRDPVATFPTNTSADLHAFARVAQEVDAKKVAVS
jgi:hypothetical protein